MDLRPDAEDILGCYLIGNGVDKIILSAAPASLVRDRQLASTNTQPQQIESKSGVHTALMSRLPAELASNEHKSMPTTINNQLITPATNHEEVAAGRLERATVEPKGAKSQRSEEEADGSLGKRQLK